MRHSAERSGRHCQLPDAEPVDNQYEHIRQEGPNMEYRCLYCLLNFA